MTPNQEPSTKNQNTKTSTSSRGTRLPEDWKPSKELIEWARTNAPGVGWKHHERFVDYWRGVPGAKGRKLDWDATWRNWMRRESDDLGAHPTSGAPAGQYKSAQVQNAELADLEKKRARLADHYIETEGMPTRAAYERAKRELDNAARGPVETSSPVGYIDGVIIDTDVREVTSE